MTAVGFDLHKRYITACALDAAGDVIAKVRQLSTAIESIQEWLDALPRPVSDAARLLESQPPEIRALAGNLRTMVRAILTNPEERVYAGWGGLGYHDARAGYVCGIFPQKGSVRLLFEHGASLADPDRLFTGGGTQTRYIEFRPGDELPEEPSAR